MSLHKSLRSTLFKITFANGTNKYFTDASCSVQYQGRYYLPNSGLRIENVYLTNKSQQIIITGLLEAGGIEKKEDLTHLQIKIDFLERYPSIAHSHFLTCFCSSVQINQNTFKINAYSFLEQLNKTLTKSYSNTCRAELADKNCNVNLQQNLKKYLIAEEVRGNEIKIIGCNDPDHFYEGGYAFFDLDENDYNAFYKKPVYQMQSMKFLITEHQFFDIIQQDEQSIVRHIIKLMLPGSSLPSYLKNLKASENKVKNYVFLLQRCDKKLTSCNTSFKNACNFRGEPYYIKNTSIL